MPLCPGPWLWSKGKSPGATVLEGILGRACSFKERQCTRAGFMEVARGLCCVPLVCIELWLTLGEVVFPMPQQLAGDGVLQCDGDASTSGFWKMTVFVVFLMLLGFGEVGTSKLSTWEVAARLGTLTIMIPSLSKVVQGRRICRDIASSNT